MQIQLQKHTSTYQDLHSVWWLYGCVFGEIFAYLGECVVCGDDILACYAINSFGVYYACYTIQLDCIKLLILLAQHIIIFCLIWIQQQSDSPLRNPIRVNIACEAGTFGILDACNI